MAEIPQGHTSSPSTRHSDRLITAGAWMLSLCLAFIAMYLGWRTGSSASAPQVTNSPLLQPTITPNPETVSVTLPELSTPGVAHAVARLAELHTTIPTRPRMEVIHYTVSTGDSVFGIAQDFNIEPETVLWANYENLQDNPDMLSPGMELNIPPVDGVYYLWQEGDSLETVAAQFDAGVADILNWSGNGLDLTNPQVEPGEWVMIPGGRREFQQWLVPTIARENSGVSRSVLGPGACEGNYSGVYGSGAFAWPTASHVLSGNDYWSGHLGIDIAGSVGDGVFASDAGVIVFAGWGVGGYGYMVMIDHGNGYQTLYAHLSAVSAYCGQSVYTGTYIGAVGSTGNSTGPHLHFEVRYMGGFISPWYVLPPP